MKKRIVSITLMLVLMITSISSSLVVNAALPEDNGSEIQPLYTYISDLGYDLSISGTTATCSSSLSGLSSVTKMKITMTLQKKNFLSWEDVESWTQIVLTRGTAFEKTRTGLSSGTYRLKVVFVVYSGTNSETATKYSSQRTC